MPFLSPVGTEDQRNSGQIWPGTWVDATPYLTKYIYGYHTGADLNDNGPRFDADAHAPVYAIGDGKVTYAQLVSKKVWGNLIVIDHGIVDGKPLFSRYAHVEAISVTKGEFVKTGHPLARVGNGEGLFPYHLHFDISTTEQLRNMPTYWPGQDRQGVKHHFVHPRDWLRQQHVLGSLPDMPPNPQPVPNPTPIPPPPAIPIWYVIASAGAQVFKSPSATAEKSGTLARGDKISISEDGVNNESLTWGQIIGGKFNGDWMAIGKADRSETYVSTNPPQ